MAISTNRSLLIVANLALAACGCNRPPPSVPLQPAVTAATGRTEESRWSEMTQASGVRFAYENGRSAGYYTILESLGGGVGLFDFDNDGRHDVFFTGGGRFDQEKRPSGLPSSLWRNLGNWQFHEVGGWAGVDRSAYYSHGCAAADFNDDGFTDLLITGYGGLELFQNQGDGTFVECAREAGLADGAWSTGCAWGDFNGDQALDLYVVHYVDWSPANDPRCPGEGSLSPLRAKLAAARPDIREVCSPRSFAPLPDIIYFSNGDGTFRDATGEAGLHTNTDSCGRGLGVVSGDVDLDGDLDIYVANDTDGNFLYLNNGRGQFDEVGSLHGAANGANGTAQGSMGVDLGDYNLDGLPDLWVVNFEKESFSLYRNDGETRFVEVSRSTGISALNPAYVGFGTAFADLDCDGDEDLIVSNGHVFYHSPLRQEPLLLVNQTGRFEKAVFPEGGYLSRLHCARGLAVSDLDDDGDLDLVFTHNDGEPNALLANEARAAAHSLRVRLIGTRSNRDAIGARLVLRTSRGEQWRQVKGGGSYLSQSDLRPFWGIPAGVEVQELLIVWPSGIHQRCKLMPGDRNVTILEEGEPGLELANGSFAARVFGNY